MTFDERTQAVAEMTRFTERQARFLVTVLLHSGVCVPRQYATFCGIVHGRKTQMFFTKLVRLGLASMYDCRHNRARIYHVRKKALYRAIGEPESRLRRPLTLGHAIHRLMVLDAIVESPELVWLATTIRRFPERLPIGIHPEGRGALVYVVTDAILDEFRVFLERQAPLLRALRAWTLRIVVPPHLPGIAQRSKQVVWNQLLTPLRSEVIDELRWYFGQVRSHSAPSRCADLDERFFHAREAFSPPRFKALYRIWKQDGDRALADLGSSALYAAVTGGAGRVEALELGHRYGHLAPLVNIA